MQWVTVMQEAKVEQTFNPTTQETGVTEESVGGQGGTDL